MSVGPSELVVILIVVLLLFGSRRLADLGKGIGEAIGGFKRGLNGESETNKRTENNKTQTAPTSQASNPSTGQTPNATVNAEALAGGNAGIVAPGESPPREANNQSNSVDNASRSAGNGDEVKG